MKKYNKVLMGLDLGTDSVGWCVTDENGKIIKKNGHHLWGYRGFSEAQDASKRRAARSLRRRYNRRQERIALLRNIFNEEIAKVDNSFFYRLDNSFYFNEDRKVPYDYTLFNSKTYNDSRYYKEFPTIYHLRKYLIHSKEKADIRFIYLAFHHMIKYRGNFLNNMEEFHVLDQSEIMEYFAELNENIVNFTNEEEDFFIKGLNFNTEIFASLKEINETTRGISLLKEKYNELLNPENDRYLKNVIIPLMVGGNVKVGKLGLENIEDKEKDDLCAKNENFDQVITDLLAENSSQERLINCFVCCKQIYEFFLIGKLLGKHKYLSDAMVERYNTHHEQLKKLKKYVKSNCPDKYDLIFRENKSNINNYVAYVGSTIVNGKKQTRGHVSSIDFYTFLKKTLNIEKYLGDDEYIKEILSLMDNEEFLLRQNSSNNGVFPYQLNKLEMKIILENQSKYYPFLKEITEGISNSDKIISILEYKIPYYVGPLMKPNNTDRSKFSWIVRTNDKIYPWNFNEVVDLEESSKQFIYKMLNKCTYLPSCYCLPKNSLLFSYFNTLNNLNKMHINGSYIRPEEKMMLIKELYSVKRKVSKKDIIQYFNSKGVSDVEITTSNNKEKDDFNFNMSSYVDFVGIFGKEYVKEHFGLIENIIRDIAIFEDKSVLAKRLRKEYGIDDEIIIKKIKGLSYSKYASISKELLMDIKYDYIDSSTGEILDSESILSIMEKTNKNLQEVLFDEQYSFGEIIRRFNSNSLSTNYDSIEEYVSDLGGIAPGMKRPLIQAYKICDEVEKILGQRIDEYYVECTRTNKAEKKTKQKSRKEKLLSMYDEAMKTASATLKEELKGKMETIKSMEDNVFRSDKYYLYFSQMCKCMYTGNPIDISDLNDDSKYNIDHIIPQSLIKDDSFDNRVLVETHANEQKAASYPIPQSILWNGNSEKARAYYKALLELNMISPEKYRRLTALELTESDLESFVNRQLVYTNQAVKGLSNAIRELKTKGEFEPKIVYSKGENVSDFRKRYGLLKSRNVNNFHHAHDAYLNILVGRTIDTYFRRYQSQYGYTEYLTWMHDNGLTTNVNNIFENSKEGKKDLYDGSGLVWSYKNDKSLKEIIYNIYNNFDIFSTERTYKGNELFGKVTVYPAGEGNIPVKDDGILSNITKYGGLKEYAFGFYSIIEYKGEYILEAIPTVFNKCVNKYLSTKYDDYKVIIEKLNINTVFYIDKKKFVITGKSGNHYVLKNKNERIFNKKAIYIVRKIEKLLELLNRKEYEEEIKNSLELNGNEVVISKARTNKNNSIILAKQELLYLYDSLLAMYSKDIYSYSASASIVNLLKESREKYEMLDLISEVKLLNSLLDYLKTNTRKSIDLSSIGGAKSSGTICMSNKLKHCRIVFESYTGYYTKTIWEID